MSKPCEDMVVMCAAGNNDLSCEECGEKWEKEKSNPTMPTTVEYNRLRVLGTTGKIDLWDFKS